MINTDADLRNVYSRLSMTTGSMVPVPVGDRRIEMFLSPSGSKVVYCGMCRENTYEGQLACCEWALNMVTKYFSGGSDVSALALRD